MGGHYTERTLNKISKSRKALSAASALGIKRGGLSMKACNIIYWSLIVPILTYGAELWILKASDIEALDKYQRYAGKRIQRFPKYTPNESSFRGLGWMRLENYIYAKKLIFVRTILCRNDDCLYKRVFKLRAIAFNEDIAKGTANTYDSPVFDILRIAIIFDVYNEIMNIITRGHWYSKQWKKLIWARAWRIEDSDWQYGSYFFRSLNIINLTVGCAKYLCWWHVSDIYPPCIKQSETMAKIVCRASSLKSDDPRYRGATFINKACSHCKLVEAEDVKHMVLTCPNNIDTRVQMLNELSTDIECREIWQSIDAPDTLKVLLGGMPHGREFNDMIPIWCIASKWIHITYFRTVRNREGVG